jgi:hypothetical protein
MALCRCVLAGGPPGFVPIRIGTDRGSGWRYEPCLDCGGSGIVSCCDSAGAGGSCTNLPPVRDVADG